MRFIYLSGPGYWISIAGYVRLIKHAKAHPNERYAQSLCDWWPCTGADIMRQFREGVQDRITQGAPYSQRGMEAQ